MKHFKRICFIAFLFNLLVMPVMSIPADPRPQKYVQPDGTEISVVRIGDENGYAYYTDDGHPLKLNAVTGFLEPSESVQFVKVKKIKSDIRKSPGLNKIRISDFPTIGEPHSLVILVEFSDAHFPLFLMLRNIITDCLMKTDLLMIMAHMAVWPTIIVMPPMGLSLLTLMW